MNEPRSQTVSVAQAAAMLHVSEKTIRRRIKTGELTARKQPLDGGGIGWRVQIGAQNGTGVDTVMDNEVDTRRNRSGQRDGQKHAQTQSEVDNAVDVMDSEMDRRAGTVMDKAMDGAIVNHEAELLRVQLDAARAEVGREREFTALLKSQLEAVTQSEAQTKAALREALRAMPKQLGAGDAPATANGVPQRAPTGAAGSCGPTTGNGQQRGADGRESAPITYDSIADEIERRMNQ